MAVSREVLAELRCRAKDVSEHAYCPYSTFRVGAALVCSDGTIFSGCNVENASYGLTVCAERNAVCQMVAADKREFTAIVIYTSTPNPTAPCGACRQFLCEFSPEATVVSCCDTDKEIQTTVRELVPHAFGPHALT